MKTFILFAALALGMHGSTCAVIRKFSKRKFIRILHRVEIGRERLPLLDEEENNSQARIWRHTRLIPLLAGVFKKKSKSKVSVRCFTFTTYKELRILKSYDDYERNSHIASPTMPLGTHMFFYTVPPMMLYATNQHHFAGKTITAPQLKRLMKKM